MTISLRLEAIADHLPADFADASLVALCDRLKVWDVASVDGIAQVALWLTDHQMNLRVSEEFGQYFVRLPLVKAPQIVHGNALTLVACNEISSV